MQLQFSRVAKQFRGGSGIVTALEAIDLEVAAGEFVCLLGPSGCGKSTLLNMVAGFEAPSSGSLTLEGQPIAGPSVQRAMMFQEAALFPWLNARTNVEFGLKSLGIPSRERRQRAEAYLRMVHLEGFEDAQPHELSGGMKQRVALARSLAVEPRVLLMDEPFAAVDAQTRDILHGEVIRLWRETAKTVLFVTHNVREAAVLATRIVVFTPRPGRIKAEFDLTGLPYPRSIFDPAVARIAEDVAATLRYPDERDHENEDKNHLAPTTASAPRHAPARLREEVAP